MNEAGEPPANVAATPSAAPPPSSRSFLARFGFGTRSSVPVEADALPVERPSFLFFGIVAGLSLLAYVTTKAWAEVVLSKRALSMEPGIVLIKKHLTFTLAYNEGGAWGLFANASDAIR